MIHITRDNSKISKVMTVNQKLIMITRSVVMEDLSGLIIAPLRDSGSTANRLELEFSSLQNPTQNPTKVTGKRIVLQILLFLE